MATRGYKIFDANWRCRGTQYRVGETTRIEGELVICQWGLHYCPRALDCMQYYPLDSDNKYAEVEAVSAVTETMDKCATLALRVVREIPYPEFVKMCTGEIREYWCGRLAQINYRDGKRDGRYVEYDGKIRREEMWRAGQRHGTLREWQNDKLVQLRHYVNDQLEGPYNRWYPTGEPEMESTYHQNQIVGRQRVWYISGEIISDITY